MMRCARRISPVGWDPFLLHFPPSLLGGYFGFTKRGAGQVCGPLTLVAIMVSLFKAHTFYRDRNYSFLCSSAHFYLALKLYPLVL